MLKNLEQAIHAAGCLYSGESVVVYDVETTGLDPKEDRIIQFSAFIMRRNGDKWEKEEDMDIYLNPECILPQKIVELTEITDEILRGKPTERECCKRICEFLEKGNAQIGYNSKFDNAFISSMTERCLEVKFVPKAIVDPFVIAKDLIDVRDLKDQSYKLCNVAEYYHVVKEGFHNASVDIENTWDVLLAEMEDLKRLRREQKLFETEFMDVFTVTDCRRWRQAFGRTKRFDRIYMHTAAGEELYLDLLNNQIHGRESALPEIDREMVIMQVNYPHLRICAEVGASCFILP